MPVARIQSITEQWVQIIRLELDDIHRDFDFAAGQYLEIEHPTGARVPLSIASAPHRLPQLELHYRSTPGDELAPLLDGLLEERHDLDLQGPFGEVTVTTLESSLMLVAGGTGISQALSIIDHVQHLESAHRPPESRVTLLWCADTEEAFYAREQLDRLSWLDASYIADARRTADNAGLVWLSKHLTSNSYKRVLVCGGPPFVYAVVDHLDAQYLDVPLESDVFRYSPRGSSG